MYNKDITEKNRSVTTPYHPFLWVSVKMISWLQTLIIIYMGLSCFCFFRDGDELGIAHLDSCLEVCPSAGQPMGYSKWINLFQTYHLAYSVTRHKFQWQRECP